MRPDEMASKEAIERDQRFRGNLKKGMGTVLSLGGAGLAGSMGAKIMPFLNEYIPIDLAFKGISKVSPKLGHFLQRGLSQGLDLKEGLEFVKNKLSGEETQGQKAQEHRNIIEQYSPELHQYMDQEIKKGRRPIEAGALAQHDKRFSKIIDKLSKDHKTPWSSILESVYGGGQKESQPQQQPMQEQPQQGQDQSELEKIIQGGVELLKKYRG